jgi:5'-3' exonuclease
MLALCGNASEKLLDMRLVNFNHKTLQFTDMLALCGDASDNVPGVRGIGPKTAAPLLQQFGDVEGVLAAAVEVGSPRGRPACWSTFAGDVQML